MKYHGCDPMKFFFRKQTEMGLEGLLMLVASSWLCGRSLLAVWPLAVTVTAVGW